MEILNPATGELLREVETTPAATVVDAAARARAALTDWRARPYQERAECLRRFRQLLVERQDELARATTQEMGKPISQSRGEVNALLARLDFFLEKTEVELHDEIVRPATAEAGSTEERIVHEPLGVIANLSAWNYPYFVGGNVFIPGLLTGNTMLYKPSEYATLTGLAIERALHDAGVPEDVFITVVGAGDVGAKLLCQRLDGVFFTGSHRTGAKIAVELAPKLVRLQLELGGKDPAYVADDVDPRAAATAMAEGSFYNAGQSCCAVERIYVHERIYDAFVNGLVDEAKKLRVGDPLDETTTLGPLARRELAIADLDAQLADARERGAEIRCGGRRLDRPGFYFEPTVVTGVNHDMALMREESFGPIIGVMPVKNDAQALELMQDTDYGLTAAVYCAERERAVHLLKELDVGTAYWNCCDRVSPFTPWSGRGNSGLGCTLSTYGIEAFLRPKAMHLRFP